MREPCAPKGTCTVLMGPGGGNAARLPGQAKAQAKGLFLVVEEQGVTKRDLKELERATKYDLKELEDKLSRDIKELEDKLSRDIKAVDVKLKELEDKLSRDIKESETTLRFEMKGMETRLLLRLGSLMILLFGILGPYMKFLMR